MMDSGNTFHFNCWKYLRDEEKKTVRKTSRPVRLSTANGKIEVDTVVDIYIDELDVTVEAFVLEDSPPILSIGRLCKHHGFACVWAGDQDPVLYGSKFRTAIQLRIKSDVPFLLPRITNEPITLTPGTSPRPDYNAKKAEIEMSDLLAKLETIAANVVEEPEKDKKTPKASDQKIEPKKEVTKETSPKF